MGDNNLEELSEYEVKRLERIAKNEAYLESIGLGNAKQKLKDMCKKTKKNSQRAMKKVKPGKERRSKRLSVAQKQNEKHVMLSYYDEDELTVVRQDKELSNDGDEFVGDEESSPVRSRSRRYTNINRADFELTKEEKQALERKIDGNYLYKFKEFLVFHNKLSEQNCRNVMRQVSKLARGDGIRYESQKYGWDEGCYFMKGQQVTPMSDIVQLMVEAQACEDKFGRDHGNGWLLSHPLKKLLLFQQFCLNNPDFLTAKCKLSQYYALANTDDCDINGATEHDRETEEDSTTGIEASVKTHASKDSEEKKEESESHMASRTTYKTNSEGPQPDQSKDQLSSRKKKKTMQPKTVATRSQPKRRRV